MSSVHPDESGHTELVRAMRAELSREAEPGEIISPIAPELLDGATWWSGAWPEPLRAGVIEPKRGYRFRPENLVLARLLEGRAPTLVCDLGAGSGSLTLLSAYRCPGAEIIAIERQSEMVDRLRRTLSVHARRVPGFPRVDLVEGDLRARGTIDALAGKVDLVVCNPPFFPPGWGRESKEPSTRLSTHGIHGGIAEFLTASQALLGPDGRALFVYDAQRVAELLAAAGAVGLGLQRALWIPDQRDGHRHKPFRVWVELGRGAGQWDRV